MRSIGFAAALVLSVHTLARAQTTTTPAFRPEAAATDAPLSLHTFFSPPTRSPYRDPFYQNDFSYLDATDAVPASVTDLLKRLQPLPQLRLDVGGEYRWRWHYEDNLRLAGARNDFHLHRTRVYGDAWYGNTARAYVEFLDAVSLGESLPVRAIDEDRADLLNAFGEVRLWDNVAGGPLSLRAGRQELLFGAQRLVSPLDWANTRRTFEGVDLLWRSDRVDADLFYTRPVRVHPARFDHADQSREFLGLYLTGRPAAGYVVDAYLLRLDEDDPLARGTRLGGFDANTAGMRVSGSLRDLLWEVEGAGQWGNFAGHDHLAGMYTAGAGYRFARLPARPTLWAYWDFATGDSNPTDGRHGTFNQLFPLSHRYFGFADLVARQNIEDLNFLLTLQPWDDRVTVSLWHHIFRLEEARDALYNAAGTPIRFDPTGSAGTDVGQELDVTLLWKVNHNVEWLWGYSHFFAGSFVSATGDGSDADFLFFQASVRF